MWKWYIHFRWSAANLHMARLLTPWSKAWLEMINHDLHAVSLITSSKSKQDGTENNRSWLSTCSQVIKPWLLTIFAWQAMPRFCWMYKKDVCLVCLLHWLAEFRVQCCFQFLTENARHSSSHQRISQKNQATARQLSIPSLFNENLYNRINTNVWADKC